VHINTLEIYLIFTKILHMKKSGIASIYLFCASFALPLQAQITELQLQQVQDKLYISKIIQKRETQYRISKDYQISADQFMNTALEPYNGSLKEGDTLLMPFNRSKFYINNLDQTVPVYYAVQQGDNLFRISRILLGLHEDKIKELNQKQGDELKTGEILLLGYYRLAADQQYTNKAKETETAISSETQADFTMENTYNTVVKNGVVMWLEDEAFHDEMFVMHISARPGSDILIMNPMNKRKIKVKVIGNIPPNTYPREIQALLSPAAARALGALDTRFYARMKYEESAAAQVGNY
jgi:hypothetical protein